MTDNAIGAGIDRLYDLKQKITAAEHKLNNSASAKKIVELKEAYSLLEDELVENFGKQKLDGARGKKASLSVTQDVKPTLEDAEATYAHIKKTGDFDLLQRRLNSAAVKLRWEEGKQVPGVGRYISTKISLRKLR